jgi:hypothetical protein
METNIPTLDHARTIHTPDIRKQALDMLFGVCGYTPDIAVSKMLDTNSGWFFDPNYTIVSK